MVMAFTLPWGTPYPRNVGLRALRVRLPSLLSWAPCTEERERCSIRENGVLYVRKEPQFQKVRRLK